MHKKNITKSFIFLILTQLMLMAGCCRKNSEIVLTEPDRTMDTTEFSGEAVSSDSSSEVAVAADSASTDSSDSDKAGDSVVSENKPALPETIMVHVCGAVLCEGVYELPMGSRVVDAVRAAGGFSEEADSEFVNQALVLSDGVKIRIPTLEETVSAGSESDSGVSDVPEKGSDTAGITGIYEESASSSDSEGGKVNINTADEAQLCTIPGIGPGRAKNIISYREEKGRFGTIDDIKKVSGIKDKFFAKIKDYITV